VVSRYDSHRNMRYLDTAMAHCEMLTSVGDVVVLLCFELVSVFV